MNNLCVEQSFEASSHRVIEQPHRADVWLQSTVSKGAWMFQGVMSTGLALMF